MKTIEKIADFFEVSVDYMLQEDGATKEPPATRIDRIVADRPELSGSARLAGVYLGREAPQAAFSYNFLAFAVLTEIV